jgi:hypothetical protein
MVRRVPVLGGDNLTPGLGKTGRQGVEGADNVTALFNR